MKIKIFILALFVSNIGRAQLLLGPRWSQANISFETAKIQKNNPITNKMEKEFFKTSFISVNSANLSSPSFYIDVPDFYFGKSFTTSKVSYIYEGNIEYISYVLLSDNDKDMVGLTFYYNTTTYEPKGILLSIFLDYMAKVPKRLNLYLSEFK